MIRIAITYFAVFVTTALPLSAAETVRSNIVIVLADDFGWGHLACNGGTLEATPQLDRMAPKGSGSRSSTSPRRSVRCHAAESPQDNSQRWRITSYLQNRAGNKSCEMADYLDPAAPSLPRLLKQAG